MTSVTSSAYWAADSKSSNLAINTYLRLNCQCDANIGVQILTTHSAQMFNLTLLAWQTNFKHTGKKHALRDKLLLCSSFWWVIPHMWAWHFDSYFLESCSSPTLEVFFFHTRTKTHSFSKHINTRKLLNGSIYVPNFVLYVIIYLDCTSHYLHAWN